MLPSETNTQVSLCFSSLIALPALEANDPAVNHLCLPPTDWHSLRVGGMVCAGILCAVGIIVLVSSKCKCKFSQKHK
uniref:FXYD domain-containing ion transport regulator n=1 Tax=Monodelphis domestica TaxID=13616 RepID=A0A5F8GUN0_MONDO